MELSTFDPCIRQCVSTNVSSPHSEELQDIDYPDGDIWQHDEVIEDVAADDVTLVDDRMADEQLQPRGQQQLQHS